MRNLKKILALVLALVMSLSLMATAGASKFPDVDAENPYATAIDVLDGLKVFQGFEDGTFKPTDTLNRAQAAVLVYRIATGDVENKYLDNYTFMQQSKFTDLEGYNWAKGYINYCQNAGIVVGTTATTFDPGAKVTGYQLLVMLLRTLGYGKAGEFADPKGWELQTATIAEREGITKNVTAGDFGAPAPRQMVAEILFRGLLSESVEYSALIPGGYTKTGETLGMREFGLEKISGVVMANEWANLNDGAAGAKVLAAGTTQMVLEDGTTRTLSVATDLDAVGLTYNAYIANGEGGAKKSLTMEKSDINVVAFNEGQAVGPKGKTLYDENRRQGSIPDLADEEGLEITSSTGYYIDYDQGWYKDCTSDYQISYVVNVNMASTTTNSPGVSLDEAETKEIITEDEHDDLVALIETAYGKKEADFPANFVFSRSIRIGDAISETDLAIMESIFDLAGRYEANNPVVKGYTIGEVYVGTTQTKDYSDEMSWKAFKAEYLNNSKETVKFDYAQAGESLRVVDNNGDGDAEYVLKVTYTMDQVIGTYKDAPELNEWRVASKYKDNNLYQPDELAVGDVVVWNVIDGKLSLWKAEAVTDTVTTKNFKDVTITTANSADPYGQSGISNKTGMDELIMNMDDKTEYVMYLDRFGYVRAYALAQGSQYALLTELYPTNSQNYNFVNNRRYIAEVQIGDAEVTEYNIANMSGKLYTGSIFNSESAWTQRINRYYNNEYNFLQPAIAHLGNPANTPGYRPGNTQGTTAVWKDVLWNRGVMQTMWNDDGYLSVFTYGIDHSYTTDNGQTEWDVGRFSYTNIADYRLDGEDITLNSASQLQKDAKGEQVYYLKNYLGRSDYRYTRSTWVDSVFDKLPEAQQTSANETALGRYFDAQVDGTAYSYTGKAEDGNYTLNNPAGTINFYPVYKVDYVQLAAQDVKGGTIHYDIDKDYGTRYNTLGNGYVDATVDTEFYIVTPNGITYKTGYADLPTVKKGEIRAAYAVATNTQNAANGYDYWVADVIVIETNGLSGTWDSVSAMYYNPFEKTGSVRYINSLNAAWKTWQPDSDDLAMLDVVPGAVYNSEGDLNDNAGDWGNHPWKNEYGFYALYNTDLDDAGDLNAQRVVHIQEKWNDYGIYAGTVQRIRSLTGSGYIDVDKQGRPAGSLQVMTAADTLGFYFDGVPVYRVADKSATEIVLNQTSYSDVKIGDPIVWVYEKGSTSKVAFVIDLKDNTPKSEYVVPAWLQNDYEAIVRYQKGLGKGDLQVFLGYDAATQSMVVDKVVKTDAGAGVAEMNETKDKASLTIPEKAARVQFTVETTGISAADLGKLIFTVDKANWRFDGAAIDGTDVIVEFIRVNDLTKSLAKVIEDVTGNNAVMTYAYFQENVLDNIDALVAAYNAETDADEKAELEEQIKATQNILDASTTENKAVADAIDAAMDTLTEAVDPTPAESFGALTIKTNNLGVTAEGDKVVIQHRAGNQAATLNIKQGELDELTIAQLVSCLTTDANETVTFVSAKNLDGQDTPDTTFAKRASSIVVKVGTCADLLTITVSNNAQALAYYPVTWTTGADITVTVENPGAQKDIKKGDTVTNGDKFLEGVVLAVAYGPNTKAVAAKTGDAYAGAWNNTAKTFTVGNKAGDLTVTAKSLFTITTASDATLISKINFTSGVTMDGSAKKVREGDTLVFTVPTGYTLTDATGGTKTVSGTTVTLADVNNNVTITLAAKEKYEISLTDSGNKLTLGGDTFTESGKTYIYKGDTLAFTLEDGFKATVKIGAAAESATDKTSSVVEGTDGTYSLTNVIGSADNKVFITVAAQTSAEKAAAALTGKTLTAMTFITKAQATEAAVKDNAKSQINGWLAGTGVEVDTVTDAAVTFSGQATSATVTVKATLKDSNGAVAYTALSGTGLTVTVSFTDAMDDVANAITKTFKITGDTQTDDDVAAAVKAEIEALTVEGAVISDVTCTAARASGVKWEVGADVTVTYGYTIKVGNLAADTVSGETIVIGLR